MKSNRIPALASFKGMNLLKYGLALVGAAIYFAGCATTQATKTNKTQNGQTAVRIDEGAKELESLRTGLKSRDDSLALDLLKGFRALRLAQGSQPADADAVNQARQAYDEIEKKLRKGGLKAKTNGERIYSIGDRENLTLQEVLTAASKNAQKLLLDGDLAKAKERNRDIVINRPTLSFAVEDAQWGLALIDALEAPGIPETTKRKLRALHESYYHDAPQDEIVKQVNVLLAEVADEKLRQHLKKLANRAWERDRRNNRIPQGVKQAALADTAPAPVRPNAPSPDSTKPVANAEAKVVRQSAEGGEAGPVFIDSLIGAGQYIQALRGLDGLNAESHGDFIRERRMRAGERFCDEKRRTAAEAYKQARAAAADSVKARLLRRTAAELDSCLFYFPETSVGAKVRRNREMVEEELKKRTR